jgi:sulfatase modifying factor 1
MTRRGLPATALLVLALGCGGGVPRAGEVWQEPATGMEFGYVPAGRYRLGSPADEPGHEAQETVHEVVLTHGYWIGRREVTQAEWLALLPPPRRGFARPDPLAPAENVDWSEAQRLAEALAARSPGERFRLPTEAEWEIACRAGATTPYATGEWLRSDQANYDGRYPLPGQPLGDYLGRTAAAGSYPPNAWGLFDFHGNVWEWTLDDHCPYPAGPTTDPLAVCASGLKVIRGGSWLFDADSARCAVRYTHAPRDRGPSLGFRLVREARR